MLHIIFFRVSSVFDSSLHAKNTNGETPASKSTYKTRLAWRLHSIGTNPVGVRTQMSSVVISSSPNSGMAGLHISPASLRRPTRRITTIIDGDLSRRATLTGRTDTDAATPTAQEAETPAATARTEQPASGSQKPRRRREL